MKAKTTADYRSDALRMATPAEKPKNPAEEAGETYEITTDELKELNENGTTTCADGTTITVTPPEEGAAPDADAMAATA